MPENLNFQINSILSGFRKVSLFDIESKELLNRQDKKFIFHTDLLTEILEQIKESYNVLDINDNSVFNYSTTYYDTEKFDLYFQHHNGRLTRNKVRSRYYHEINKTYFEIKSKTNKAKTVKNRIFIKDGEDDIIDFKRELSTDEIEEPINSAIMLLKNNLKISPAELKPSLVVSYTRITLLHRVNNEKITVDFNISLLPVLKYENPESISYKIDKNKNDELKNLAIAETKQDRLVGMSEFELTMNKLHIRSASVSKYCTGLVLLKPEIKHNRFKNKMNYIHKISGNNNGL